MSNILTADEGVVPANEHEFKSVILVDFIPVEVIGRRARVEWAEHQ